jgi:hypothetical protein
MRTPVAAVALAAAALPIALAGPANAELYGVDDPVDTYHGSDVRSLSVRNGAENLNITTVHEGLRRDPATGSAGMFYVDTDREDRGPEYVLVAGFVGGTDYVLRHTEGFGRENLGRAVEHGDYLMRVDYDRERVRIKLSQPALGNPDAVRVSVRVSGTRTDGTSHGLVDWVGTRHWFTPWLEQG